MAMVSVLPASVQNYLSWQMKRYASGDTAAKIIAEGPFVTISRQYGCEAHLMATRLAERLSEYFPGPAPWTVMGKEVIEAIAEKKGSAAKFVDALNSGRRGHIRQTVELLCGNSPTEYQSYEELVSSLQALARAGRVILLGRGGSVVCAGMARGLHVRLMAPFQWCAEKIARERNIGILEAQAIASREEIRREAFARDFTGQDVANPHLYDVIFNNERNSVDTIAEAVFSLMKNREII